MATDVVVQAPDDLNATRTPVPKRQSRDDDDQHEADCERCANRRTTGRRQVLIVAVTDENAEDSHSLRIGRNATPVSQPPVAREDAERAVRALPVY